MSSIADNPALTVRALAEMLDKPLYEQLLILENQKYADRAPGSFRVPYYRPALTAIRRFYRSGGEKETLEGAIAEIQASNMPAARKENNVRVIHAFQRSSHAKRNLNLISSETMTTTMSGVEVRYTADIAGTEREHEEFLLFNFRQAPITPELAKRTLELALWVLNRSKAAATPEGLEFIDLAAKGRVYRIKSVRQKTVRRAQQNARAIAHLWQRI